MRAVLQVETIADSALHWRLLVPASDHPIFVGHFPGSPVLPGVVVLGWMIAAAERFLGRELLPPTRLHNVKFPLVLLPGQTVDLNVTPAPAGRLSVRVTSAGGTHATVVVEPGLVS